MSAYRVTPTAQKHIDRLYRISMKVWGASHARTYLESLDASVMEIVDDIDLARPRPDRHPDLRARRCKAHILYVALRPEGLILVAVLHHRMDPARHLPRALKDLSSE